MLTIQILLVLFSGFVAVRTAVRYRRGSITVTEFLMWTLFWVIVALVVLMPDVTQVLAGWLGVGRGADAVFYLALIALSYAFFRLYLKLRHQEQQLTQLVRKLALDRVADPAAAPSQSPQHRS